MRLFKRKLNLDKLYEQEQERIKKEEEEEKKKRIAEKTNRRNERVAKIQAVLKPRLKNIIIFPSSQEKFEELMGYKTEMVDLGRNDKGLIYQRGAENPFNQHYYRDFQRKIAKAEIIALVDAKFTRGQSQNDYITSVTEFYYGLPVRKKQTKKNGIEKIMKQKEQ